MSQKRVKQLRRLSRKYSDKIRVAFLNSIEHERFGLRLKIALKIIFPWNPPWRKKSTTKKERLS